MSNPSTTTLSSKGQVVIPEEVRVRLGLTPWTRFVEVAEGDVVVFEALEAPGADEVAGLVAQARAVAREEGLRVAECVGRCVRCGGRREGRPRHESSCSCVTSCVALTRLDPDRCFWSG